MGKRPIFSDRTCGNIRNTENFVYVWSMWALLGMSASLDSSLRQGSVLEVPRSFSEWVLKFTRKNKIQRKARS
jgi:hypothetical protein